MSHLQYFSYPGYGQYTVDEQTLHQLVRVDNQLIMSGQVGLDPNTSGHAGIHIPSSLREEMSLVFSNVVRALKDAGGKALEQVYKMTIYVAPLDDESVGVLLEEFKKAFPKHKPVMTLAGAEKLAYWRAGQRVEIDAYAHLG